MSSKIKNPMRHAFGTDLKKEVEGVVHEYFGYVRVQLARAGGRNERFAKAYEIHSRPHRQAMRVSPESIPKNMQEAVVHNAYLDGVITGFWTNVNYGQEDENGQPKAADWQPVVILDDDAGPVPANKENLKKYFQQYPDFFQSIMTDSQDVANYRREELAAESGN